MSKYIVDIHGEIEGDYEIVGKYEEQEPTTKNLCDTCGNIINCMMQSGIVRTECSMYSSPKNDLGVDCISRVEVIDYLCKHCPDDGECFKDCDEIKHLRQIPSVIPIRPKGHWIWELDETPSTPISPYELNYAGWFCSCCHEFPDEICEWDNPDEPPTYKFCPNCGSDNREVKE